MSEPSVATRRFFTRCHYDRPPTALGFEAPDVKAVSLPLVEVRGEVELVLAVYPWDITISTTPSNGSAINVVDGPVRGIA
jgi:hypothetical protein